MSRRQSGLPVLLFPLLLLSGGLTESSAGTLPISIRGTDAPAVDLVFQGRPIDRDQAVELKKRGVDLSTLDPLANDAWSDRSLPATSPDDEPDSTGVAWNFPADGATVAYDSDLGISQGLVRGRVLTESGPGGFGGQPFNLMMSLGSHASMARAALLRRLGYPVKPPRWYRSLTVRFKNVAARDLFIDNLASETLTARSRWVRSAPEKEPVATFQDLILEPAQIDVPVYHWGVLAPKHMKGRRTIRALIVPLVLLDVLESVNLYSYEAGKILDDNILLTHPYAASFGETTYEDARWITRRLARLSRADIQEIVAQGRYPEDVAALVTEKAVARRNHLVQMFDVGGDLPIFQRVLPYTARLNHGAVVDGKLTQANYPGYAMRFSYGDPESPLRMSEVSRFLAIQGISDAMSALANKANQYLQARTSDDVAEAHQAKLMRDFYQHLRDHPDAPFSRPVGAWGGPIGGFNLAANRNVVTGTYYGSESKVQLVDNISVQASIGYFMGFDGLPQTVIPAVAGNLVMQRNYLHIRPIADMRSALRANWGDLFVPRFKAHLAGMLDTTGILGDQAKLDEKLKGFLEGLKEGEMMIIVDSVAAGVRGQVQVPIPLFLAPGLTQFNPAFGVGGGVQPTMLRRTTFTRTADGVQVYLQDAGIAQLDVEFNFSWWINVLKVSHLDKFAQGRTKAYLLDKEPDSPEMRKNLVIALRALLSANSSELLEENFKPYELRHRVGTAIDSARLLWWKWAGIEENHRVSVAPPGHPDKVRTLYSTRVTRTRGVDGYAFFSDIVSALTKNTFTPSSAASPYNPSNAFLGNAQWVTTRTEAEITPTSDSSPVTVIEHHFGGWLLGRRGLDRILDAVETKAKAVNLDRPLIRRDEFATAHSLQMYEILSTLVIYEGGMKRINETVFDKRKVAEVVNGLIELDGGRARLDAYCAAPLRRAGNALLRLDSYSEVEGNTKYKWRCLKPWMRKMLEFRKNYRAARPDRRLGAEGGDLAARQRRVQWTNNVMGVVEKHIEFPRLLKWLGKDNYFFQIKVSGFRTRDENGDNEYLSDSVGSFDQARGSGVFRDFARKYGILTSELSATYLSEGF